ncbi:MAG TPA: retropepsin-like aspartic protease, partial [Candidatus Acidoferrales bacterium]|nr:retropepsin-like aspartic protease [Candidatus Acidoferrales bacterium]
MNRTWVFALCTAAALCAIPRPGVAQQYQPVSISVVELLARVDKAYGTRAPGAYHRVNRTVTSDGVVTVTETYTTGRDFKSVETLSGFQQAWGEFQGRAWQQDRNGFVRSKGDEPPEPFAYARDHPSDPASGVTLLGITGTPPQFVVQIEPRKGLHQLRYFDAQTYLLTRIETTDYDGHVRTTAFGDYKRVGGEFTPLTTTSSDDLSARTSRTEATTYESIPEAAANVDVPASKSVFDLGSRTAVTVPAKFVNDKVLVTLTISGAPYDFVLDSGAGSILFDTATARKLNLSIVAPYRASFGGDFTTGSVRVPEVGIGDLHAAGVAMDVAPYHESAGAVGLLGCDFFASGALLVDYANHTVTLMASAPADPAADGWAGVPITLNSCIPEVRAKFNETPGNFVVDLGASATLLSRHYFESLAIPETSTRTEKGFFVGGAPVEVRTYVIDELHLGDLAYQNIYATVPSSRIVDARTIDGLIGRTFLRHFNLLFDYAHQKIYFKQIPDP